MAPPKRSATENTFGRDDMNAMLGGGSAVDHLLPEHLLRATQTTTQHKNRTAAYSDKPQDIDVASLTVEETAALLKREQQKKASGVGQQAHSTAQRHRVDTNDPHRKRRQYEILEDLPTVPSSVAVPSQKKVDEKRKQESDNDDSDNDDTAFGGGKPKGKASRAATHPSKSVTAKPAIHRRDSSSGDDSSSSDSGPRRRRRRPRRDDDSSSSSDDSLVDRRRQRLVRQQKQKLKQQQAQQQQASLSTTKDTVRQEAGSDRATVAGDASKVVAAIRSAPPTASHPAEAMAKQQSARKNSSGESSSSASGSGSTDGSSSDSSSSSEDSVVPPAPKIQFVPKHRRGLVSQDPNPLEDNNKNDDTATTVREKDRRRRQESRRMVQQAVTAARQDTSQEVPTVDGITGAMNAMVSDTDVGIAKENGDDDDVAAALARRNHRNEWNVREVERLLQDWDVQREREEHARERERRRALTDAELVAEQRAAAAQTETSTGKATAAAPTTYFHKGAFYMDESEWDASDVRYKAAEYAAATTEHGTMAANRLGRANQSKYKGLAAEDTTRAEHRRPTR